MEVYWSVVYCQNSVDTTKLHTVCRQMLSLLCKFICVVDCSGLLGWSRGFSIYLSWSYINIKDPLSWRAQDNQGACMGGIRVSLVYHLVVQFLLDSLLHYLLNYTHAVVSGVFLEKTKYTVFTFNWVLTSCITVNMLNFAVICGDGL